MAQAQGFVHRRGPLQAIGIFSAILIVVLMLTNISPHEYPSRSLGSGRTPPVGPFENPIPGLSYSLQRSLPCVHSSISFELNSSYVDTTLSAIHGSTLINPDPFRMTMFLLKAALMHVPGDIVETGTWKGGSFAAMAKAWNQFDTCGRTLWAFDSFQGLPKITHDDLEQHGGKNGSKGLFAATRQQFDMTMGNILTTDVYSRLLSTGKINVVEGWFNETTPNAAISQIAFLRLDGDLFSSTWDVLTSFYHLVAPGGYVYIDDYFVFNGCLKAVNLFRQQNKIYEPLHFNFHIDSQRVDEAAWWQKRW